MEVILVQQMARPAGRCASTGVKTAAIGLPISKLQIAALTTNTIFIVRPLATSDTAVLNNHLFAKKHREGSSVVSFCY